MRRSPRFFSYRRIKRDKPNLFSGELSCGGYKRHYNSARPARRVPHAAKFQLSKAALLLYDSESRILPASTREGNYAGSSFPAAHFLKCGVVRCSFPRWWRHSAVTGRRFWALSGMEKHWAKSSRCLGQQAANCLAKKRGFWLCERRYCWNGRDGVHRRGKQLVIDCLDPATGKQRWQAALATKYVSTISTDDGPRCTPVVHKAAVFVLGPGGELAATERGTGKIMWSRDLATEFRAPMAILDSGSSPLIEGDKLLINVGATRPSDRRLFSGGWKGHLESDG